MSVSFLITNEEMRMEGQCTSFSSKTVPGRFYIVLVCLYPCQECSLGLGSKSQLQGVHVTWEQGQWSSFYKESLLSAKDILIFSTYGVLNILAYVIVYQH